MRGLRIGRVLMLALVGVGLGSLIGAIAIGDPVYLVLAPISLTLVFVVAGFVGSRTRSGRIGAQMPGIRNPGDPIPAAPAAPEPAEAVLNPEPTAIPVTGMTLNGVPVESVGPPKPPREPGSVPVGLSRALGVAVILLAAMLTLLPSARIIAWGVTGLVTEGRWDAADPRTGSHQQEMVDDLAAAAGGYEFVSISFYDGYVLATARTTPTATTTDTFEWRYGRASRIGPASGDLEGLFDASGIDFSVIGEVARFAQEDSGWSDFSYTYPSVRDRGDGEPEISVSIGTTYYSGSYTFTIEGEYVSRYGTGWD